jgi:hypothetical protein
MRYLLGTKLNREGPMTRITIRHTEKNLEFAVTLSVLNTLPQAIPVRNLDFNVDKSYILSVIMRTISSNKTKGGGL